jgi:hypothetical protein
MYASYLLGLNAILILRRRRHAKAREEKMTLFPAIAAVITRLSERPHACLITQTIHDNELYNTKVQKQ